MSAPLLTIEHLEVRYGDLIGVSDVSLEVPEGSVVAQVSDEYLVDLDDELLMEAESLADAAMRADPAR